MKIADETLTSCASIGICIALIGTPAQAVNVNMVFKLPVVGTIGANFVGFDLNRDGYIRSSEGEVQSATASSLYGGLYFPTDPPIISTVDIVYKYWAASISPNVIETQLNRFNIYNSESGIRFGEDRSFSYVRGDDFLPGYPYGYTVSYSQSRSETNPGWLSAELTAFSENAQSGTDFLQTMTSTGPLIPEPSTYAMLLVGLGALGFVARRRSE